MRDRHTRSTALLLSVALLSLGSSFAQFSSKRVIGRREAALPQDLKFADIDADGDLDAIVPSSAANGTAWFANDGLGNFGAATPILDTALAGRTVAALDADGDGDLDVVVGVPPVLLQPAQIRLYFQQADHHFAGGHSIGNDAAFAMDAGDLDDDGDQDLIVQGATFARPYLNDGSGSFTAGAQLGGSAGYTRKIIFTDLDDDGHKDLLGWESSLFWHKGNGDGTFQALYDQVSSLGPMNAVDVGDIDGDGDPDVMLNSNERLSYCLNDGSGHFGQVTPVGDVISAPTLYHDLWLIDLDGDSDLDIAACDGDSSEIKLWRNVGGLQFVRTDVVPRAASTATSGLRVADVDADGHPDLGVISYATGLVSWIRNTPALDLADQRVIAASPQGTQDVIAGPLNAFGRRDLIGTQSDQSPIIARYPALENDVFGKQEIISGHPANSHAPCVADMDADGVVDLAYCATDGLNDIGYTCVQYSAFDGPYVLPSVITTNSAYQPFEVADLNGDALPDMIVGFADTLAWIPNLGGGAFGPLQHIDAHGATVLDIHPSDLDDDGDMDLLCSTYDDDRVARYMNDGNGVFIGPLTVTTAGSSPSSVMTADVDLDGNEDLVMASYDDNEVAVMLGNGSGGFGARSIISTQVDRPFELQLTDLDADGDTDILVSDSFEAPKWFANAGSGQFQGPLPLPSSRYTWAADLDNDGDQDLFSNGLDPVTGYNELVWFENYYGSPYRVHGSIFLDLNADGQWQQPQEPGAPWLPVECNPSISAPLTDSLGNYTLFLDPGTYIVTVPSPGPFWTQTTPVAGNVLLTAANPDTAHVDFGFAPIADSTVLVPTMQLGAGICGNHAPFWIDLANQGSRIESGELELVLPPLLEFAGATPAPDSIVGSSIYFSFDSLWYFQHTQRTLMLLLPSAQHLGDTLIMMLRTHQWIVPGQDSVVQETMLAHVLDCAYDPNDKMVIPGGSGPAGEIAQSTPYLDYTIRFQNTGTAHAADVFIEDRLSPFLDPSSLSAIAFSHTPTSIRIEEDGTLIIRFDGIDLPDSGSSMVESQGFVRFRIALLPGLAPGTRITNMASIHFDLNEAVTTDEVVNTLMDCSAWEALITSVAPDVLQANSGANYQWFRNGTLLVGETDQELFVQLSGSYSVQVTNAQGCVSTSDPLTVVIDSVTDRNDVRAALVPNPIHDMTRLIFGHPPVPGTTVRIMDAQGRVERIIDPEGEREVGIARNSMADGIHLVLIQVGGGPTTALRMVVQ